MGIEDDTLPRKTYWVDQYDFILLLYYQSHNKRKQTQPRTNGRRKCFGTKAKLSFISSDSFLEESESRLEGFSIDFDSIHWNTVLLIPRVVLRETVSKASRGRGMTTRHRAALEASEIETKALVTCPPRAILSRKASAAILSIRIEWSF
jgi:hypothetical protein